MTNVRSVGKIEVACEEVLKGKHLPLVAKKKKKKDSLALWRDEGGGRRVPGTLCVNVQWERKLLTLD